MRIESVLAGNLSGHTPECVLNMRPYVFTSIADHKKEVWYDSVPGYCSYYRHFVLRQDGTLLLERILYQDDFPDDEVNEVLSGSFCMKFTKKSLCGPLSIYVPFHDGVIDENLAAWVSMKTDYVNSAESALEAFISEQKHGGSQE